MAVIQNLDVNLRGQTGDFQQKMAQAGKSFQNFRQTVTTQGAAVQSSVGGMFGGIAGMAAKYLGPLAAGAFLGWGVKLAAEAETAQTAFATMLGSADKAKTLLGQIGKFASETPFETGDLRKAAQSLLSFGVDAGQVMNRIKTLGDVAAGSSSDIKDLALIFGKTLAKGKFELEQGNQLAERGIPIYSVLSKQLGVSQAQLMKMISAGKVSASQVQTAFETMSAAGGIFENAMAKQSTTLAGMWSTLIDNISLIATDLGQIIVEAFGFKEGLGALTTATDTIRNTISEWKPVIMATRDIFVAVFQEIQAGISAFVAFIQPTIQPVLDYFTNTFGGTFTAFRDNVLSVFYAVQYAVQNWSAIFDIAVSETALSLVSFYEDLKNIFVNLIPTIFTSFGTFTMSFFKSLGANIGKAFKEIWDYIKSGGKDKIEFTWTPVTEGFGKAIQEIGKAANRDLTDTEKLLMADIQKQRDGFTVGMGEFVDQKMGELKAAGEETKATLEGTAPTDQPQESKSTTKADKTEAIQRGSAAAFSAIAAARRASDPQIRELSKQTTLAKETNKKLEAIEKNTQTGLAVAAL